MAKKNPKNKRDDTIAFKATDAERKAYEAAADADGRTLSGWIRHVLNQKSGITSK